MRSRDFEAARIKNQILVNNDCEVKQMSAKKMPKAQLDELVDLKSVVIDRSLPIEQRVHSYIEQIKNPYFFKVGSTPVRVSYSNSNMTVQNAFHNLVSGV